MLQPNDLWTEVFGACLMLMCTCSVPRISKFYNFLCKRSMVNYVVLMLWQCLICLHLQRHEQSLKTCLAIFTEGQEHMLLHLFMHVGGTEFQQILTMLGL